MKVKSHAEVANIPDPKQRYLVELGSEKEEDANQCIDDASAEVVAMLRPLWSGTTNSSSGITFSINTSTRNAVGLEDPLTKAIHAYLVDSALAKYYVSVAQGTLAAAHNAKLPAEITVINELAYRKIDPTYS